MQLYTTAVRGSGSFVNKAIHGKRCAGQVGLQGPSPILGDIHWSSRERWMWCGRADLSVLGHATDLLWGPKRGPVTPGFSPKPPLLPKACGHVIGTVGRGRSWQDRHGCGQMCLKAWIFIYFKEATNFAHVMHGSSCCAVLTTVLTHHNKKATQRLRTSKSHCIVQRQTWSLPSVGNPNVMELIINRIKTD